MATSSVDKFSKSVDAQSYDSYAESYGKYIATLSAPLAIRLCELAELKAGQQVLDVASRTGVSSRAAAKIVGTTGSVTGIDLSEGMVRTSEYLSSTYSNLTFLQMDAEKMDFPDNSFDSIIALCAMTHFPHVDLAIDEMFRVVRPGGYVVVSYGAGFPAGGAGLMRHRAKRVGQVAQKRCLFAPALLCKLSAKVLGQGHEDGVLTSWSKHHPHKHIMKCLRSSGFSNVSQSWDGHDVEFSSPDMYWEAQLSIVTDVRKRLDKADPKIERQLKSDFLIKARKVVALGGKLLYPYGAIFIKAQKPA